jgi:GST-like protein
LLDDYRHARRTKKIPIQEKNVLDLYTDATPNGLKISICLEELGLPYNVRRVFLGGDQMTPNFAKLNPNNKIPVLVDDGLIISESGAILIYLARKTGKLLPEDTKTFTKTIEMIMFQMSSVGPMFGQLMVFAGAWSNNFPPVTGRYVKEMNRILAVLEARLEGQAYFAGNAFTIADIAMLPWIRAAFISPFGKMLVLGDKSNLNAWWERVSARPAVIKGLSIPEPFSAEKQFAAFVDATVGLGELHS